MTDAPSGFDDESVADAESDEDIAAFEAAIRLFGIRGETDLRMTEIDAVAQVALARGIAFVAHRGQVDQLGADYIDHPARVAAHFNTFDEPVEKAAAWLHDVIEDTEITRDELLAVGVLPEVADVVELLTRHTDVASDDYYLAIRRDPAALAVKLADIADNTAEWRTCQLDDVTRARLSAKYGEARRMLLEGIG